MEIDDGGCGRDAPVEEEGRGSGVLLGLAMGFLYSVRLE
jgi:hypothetical protein